MAEEIQLPVEKKEFKVEQFRAKYAMKQRVGVNVDSIVYMGAISQADENAVNILSNIIIEEGITHVLIVRL